MECSDGFLAKSLEYSPNPNPNRYFRNDRFNGPVLIFVKRMKVLLVPANTSASDGRAFSGKCKYNLYKRKRLHSDAYQSICELTSI